MNNEIKEILDFLKVGINKLCISKPDFSISYNDVKILLDYITNLQQENERLKQPKIFIDTQDMEERYGEELYKEYLERENKRLNNIINELKKWLEEQHQFIIEIPAFTKEISIEHKTMECCYEDVLDKIKELENSGSDK